MSNNIYIFKIELQRKKVYVYKSRMPLTNSLEVMDVYLKMYFCIPYISVYRDDIWYICVHPFFITINFLSFNFYSINVIIYSYLMNHNCHIWWDEGSLTHLILGSVAN